LFVQPFVEKNVGRIASGFVASALVSVPMPDAFGAGPPRLIDEHVAP
jgi:hypothetical protein